MWNMKSGTCSQTLTEHTDKIWAIDVIHTEADGTHMLTGGGDSKVVVWEDSSKQVEEELFTASKIRMDREM